MNMIRWYDNGSAGEAIARAREARKPLLLDLYSPTCMGCAKLIVTTYRDAAVVHAIEELTIPLKYNTANPDVWFKRLNGNYAHHWHPNIAILDDHCREARRFIGYLPPREFLGHLFVGVALWHLYHKRAAESLELLEQTVRAPGANKMSITAEALYWAGVAAYRAGGGLDALRPFWVDLIARFPANDWALRADCLDVVIPPGGFNTYGKNIELLGDASALRR